MNSITPHSGSGQHKTTRVVRLALPSLLVALLLTGCQNGVHAKEDTNPVGDYMLVSVDGNKVPCAVQHEGHALTVESGTFTINADGTCASNIRFSVAGREVASRQVKATYTREGHQLTMKWEGAGMTLGAVHGDTFTMTNEGNVFAYRK